MKKIQFKRLFSFCGLILVLVTVPVPGTAAQTVGDSLVVRPYTERPAWPFSMSPKLLAHYLTFKDTSEAQQLLNLYTWITNNVAYEVKQTERIRRRFFRPWQTLVRKKGVCYQYTDLLRAMAREVGIQVVELDGYSRNFYEGDVLYESDHAWNAVRLDSAWYFLDATWDSGELWPERRPLKEWLFQRMGKPYRVKVSSFVQLPKLDYFLVQPEQFLSTHLPADLHWQLVEYPVSLAAFSHKAWEGYRPYPDTVVPRFNKLEEYRRVVDGYVLAQPYQRRLDMAAGANLYNEDNHAHLAEANLAYAGLREGFRGPATEWLARVDEVLELYNLAKGHAQKHNQSARQAAKVHYGKARDFQRDMTQTARVHWRRADQQLGKTERLYQATETQLPRFEARALNLQNKLVGKLPTLAMGRYPVDSFPRVADSLELLIVAGHNRLRDLEDSVGLVIEEIRAQISLRSDLQHALLQYDRWQNGLLRQHIFLLRMYESPTKLWAGMSKLDSIGARLDSVEQGITDLERSTTLTERRLNQLLAAKTRQVREMQGQIREQCRASRGKACHADWFADGNEHILTGYRHELEILAMRQGEKEGDLAHFAELLPLADQMVVFSRLHQAQLNYYGQLREAEIAFGERRSNHYMNGIIQRAEYRTRKLRKKQRAMQQKLRQRGIEY